MMFLFHHITGIRECHQLNFLDVKVAPCAFHKHLFASVWFQQGNQFIYSHSSLQLKESGQMVALKSVKSVKCLSASLLTLGSAQTRLALLSLNRSLPWSLLQLPRRVVVSAAAATSASITASGGALVVVGHRVLVGLGLGSP